MHLNYCFKLLKCNLITLKRLLCTQASSTPNLLSIYENRVTKGEIENDDFQRDIVEVFDGLNKAVSGYAPQKPSYFSKIFRKETVVKAPKGVYLYGSVGCGKTMLMDLFHDHCCVDDDHKRRVHFHAFMLDVHSRIHEKKSAEMSADSSRKALSYNPIPSVAQDLCDESWLLCLDEFQVTDIGDAMILKLLFSELFNRGVVVVATSNRPPDDLYLHGLQRSNFLPFIPLLKKHCTILPLDSEVDYRQKSLPSKQSIYLIDDQKGGKELDRLFKIFASRENDTIRAKTLHIKGRNVTFNKTCGQVADCTFEELCDRPLGAIDYVTMSQVFHTIIIRKIPQLTVEKKSPMRRFITLIDTLYNHKVRTLFSSAVPVTELFKRPEKSPKKKEATEEDDDDEEEIDDNKRKLMDDLALTKKEAKAFDGEEEAFAFSRTLSRITEMQTDHYWNARELSEPGD